MTTGTCILIILLVALISYTVKKHLENKENYNILYSIRGLYKILLPLIKSSYDLKICPKCYENYMDLKTVSPSGQSIEYICLNCKKKLTSKILSNKDNSEVIRLFNEIKRNIVSLNQPLSYAVYHEDAQTDFLVDNEDKRYPLGENRQPIRESVRNEV
jgi:hypothetical protein